MSARPGRADEISRFRLRPKRAAKARRRAPPEPGNLEKEVNGY